MEILGLFNMVGVAIHSCQELASGGLRNQHFYYGLSSYGMCHEVSERYTLIEIHIDLHIVSYKSMECV
jgi:hypothetical protein